ncbi:MAG: MerR family transcriptional regulator [Thermoanaerobaculia bacterium]|nr:MerR family transcriptional regulator [Thermoanaerobaculia bacterium]
MAKKLFYRIGEACKKVDIQPYVLRYWETEFPNLDPDKSKSGQRVYSEEDIELIRRIKELLYEEGYTIAGAKKRLAEELEADGSPGEPAGEALDSEARERVETLESGLREILDETRDLLELLE